MTFFFFSGKLTVTFHHKKGNGYVHLPVPEVLSFASPDNDAAITFVNSTTVDGVVFQHGRAFDIVASADALVVSLHFFFFQFALFQTKLRLNIGHHTTYICPTNIAQLCLKKNSQLILPVASSTS